MKLKLIFFLMICSIVQSVITINAMDATDLLSAVRADDANVIGAYNGDVNQLIPHENKLLTAVSVATMARKLDALEALLMKKGANPNQPMITFSKNGQNGAMQTNEITPLHLAAQTGNFPALISLLEAGANPHAKDSLGATPLWHAARGGFTACACFLMLYHANPSEVYDSRSPYEIAPAETEKLMHVMGKSSVNALYILLSELFSAPLSQELIDFKNSPFYHAFARRLPRV